MAEDTHLERDVDDGGRWPLVKVFDVVAIGLIVVVFVRVVGGVVSALGVPAVHLDLGASSGAPATLNFFDALPTSLRFQYGTSWADVTSGLVLLVGLSLVVLPRIVWDVADTDGLNGAWIVRGILVLSVLAVAAATVGIVYVLLHSDRLAASGEALKVSNGIGALGLTVVVLVLAWFAPTARGTAGNPDRSIPEASTAGTQSS